MEHIYSSSDLLIGRTPLLDLRHISAFLGLDVQLLAKLEYLNPSGSVKDRVAKAMLDDALARGLIGNDAVIIEPTSGNTGIGLAAVGAARGYRTIIVLPDTMSEERRRLIRAYGAELVLTDGKEGMKGAIAKAKELASSIPGSFIPSQFENKANPEVHKKTTGPEIWADTDGTLDAFVAGVGTGGTLSGVGAFLKSQDQNIKVFAVEPDSSAVLSGGTAGKHKIQGIGAGFIPSTYDKSVADEILRVSDESAFEMARLVGRKEGVLVGISSGAALSAAIALAERKDNLFKRIVILFPDGGDRYLSTPLFD